MQNRGSRHFKLDRWIWLDGGKEESEGVKRRRGEGEGEGRVGNLAFFFLSASLSFPLFPAVKLYVRKIARNPVRPFEKNVNYIE